MHADHHDMSKSIRSYIMVFVALMVFTVITVAVTRLQFSVGMGIAVALIIASIKASMVAGVFMHLSHEKMWIYGSLLLTAAFFVVLLLLPKLIGMDHIGTPIHAGSDAHAPAHGAAH